MPSLLRNAGPLAVALVVLATAGEAQDRLLTLNDVSPELGRLIGGTPLDFVAAAEIAYGVTGNADYDEFFRSSAVAYGGFVVGRGLADDATLTLKGYARSKAAVAELEEEIAEITGGADPDDWTTEQSLAVLRAADMKDQLSAEERGYLVRTAANVGATLPVVEGAVEASARLTQQAPDLVSGARSAFGLRRAGGVANNVRRSADRLSNMPTEGTALAESLVVLSQGLAFVAGGG